MVATISNVSDKLITSYKKTIDTQEKIDTFLDQINEKKKSLNNLTTKINKINQLLCEATWVENISESDKLLLKAIVVIGKDVDHKLKKYYALQKRDLNKTNLFKDELFNFKLAIDDHTESIDDFENVFFYLRENQELDKIYESLS